MAKRDRQMTGREEVLIPAVADKRREDRDRGGTPAKGTEGSRVTAAAGQLLRRLRTKERDGSGHAGGEGERL